MFQLSKNIYIRFLGEIFPELFLLKSGKIFGIPGILNITYLLLYLPPIIFSIEQEISTHNCNAYSDDSQDKENK